MLVKCKNVIPGQRYRTQKDVLVEVSVGTEKDQYGNVMPLIEASSGRVLVYRVDEKTGKIVANNAIPIQIDYELEDGRPETESRKLHHICRGRKPHVDKTWRGWAFKNRKRPESLLALAKTLGMTVKATANYYLLSWGSRTLGAVFRNGDLGFPQTPQLPYDLTPEVSANLRFCPHRLKLRTLSDPQFDELCSTLKKDFAQKITDIKQKDQNDAP